MNTTIAKKEVNKQWYVVDATDQVLGRLAVRIANVLRGRHKPIYTPNVDCGDHVVVINAEKVKVTGKKEDEKEYMFYSGYVGGEKYVKLSEFRSRRPEYIIEMAVKVGDKIGQAVGIQASHAGSTVINNILVDNSQNLVLPSVQSLLDNVIDVSDPDSGDA